jgi:hypothetical protein
MQRTIAAARWTGAGHAEGAQYKLGIKMPTMMMELHADFLAGWYLGNRSFLAESDFACHGYSRA